MKPLIKPSKLRSGDKVATVSLSWGGPGTYPWKYEAGVRQLKDLLGVTVVPMPHALRDADWIAKNPEARAEDLMKAFSDPSIKAIISTIGGEDSIRIVPFIDLEIIRKNPKIFMGFSDTTITHFCCFKAGLSSFYGPSIMAGFAENGGLFPYVAKSVQKTLCETAPIGVWEGNKDGWVSKQLPWQDPQNQSQKRPLFSSTAPRFLQGATPVRGRLIGGCAEVLEFMKGTSLWPSPEEWEGAVLFIETSEEGASSTMLRRWLRNYAAQGIIQKLSGILSGKPGGIEPEAMEEYDTALLDIVRNECGRKDIPIVSNLDFGHTDPVFVLPYGCLAEIDPVHERISLLEAGVVE